MMAQNNFPVAYPVTSTNWKSPQETATVAEASRVRDAAHTADTHAASDTSYPLDDASAPILPQLRQPPLDLALDFLNLDEIFPDFLLHDNMDSTNKEATYNQIFNGNVQPNGMQQSSVVLANNNLEISSPPDHDTPPDALILRSPDLYPLKIVTPGRRALTFATIQDHQQYIKKRESNNQCCKALRQRRAKERVTLADRAATLEQFINSASQPRVMRVKNPMGGFILAIVTPLQLMAQPIVNVCAPRTSASINRNAGPSSSQPQSSRSPPTETTAPANKRRRRN